MSTEKVRKHLKAASPKSPFDFGGGLKMRRALSHGIANSGNLIIQGDNFAALPALTPEFSGVVRCIYIDPPYNNQERYNHYVDGLDHDTWLKNLSCRLELLWGFLRQDGSIWISIDDRELHYLKVAADKVFGRTNFISTIVWEHRTTRENRKVFSNNHEYVLVYAKNPRAFREARNALAISESVALRHQNPDNDPRGPWQSVSANVQAGHATKSQFYELIAPNGRKHSPPNGRCWVYNIDRMMAEIKHNNIWFGREGNGVPRLKKFLNESKGGLTPETLWQASDVGTTKLAKNHLLHLFPGQPVFDTPKPEKLIERIISIATDKGDYVLDAFLGSATTTAVAHKMGRRYIGIESGPHASSLCVDRMKAVVEGEQGGISKHINWHGGGGFTFYSFSKSLI
jgi:adenine-specific DNA-methyltransferase